MVFKTSYVKTLLEFGILICRRLQTISAQGGRFI